jgi:DNA topoisomerase I
MPTRSHAQKEDQKQDRAHARAAGLVYVSDVEPGIRRVPKGTGFSYRLPGGTLLTKASELARIRALAVPPAWVDVWICPNGSGHIQATGRDDRGRKQYRYHNAWREMRDENKYDRILDFARLLPRIRRQVERDMGARGGPTKEKVLATVVSLLDKTLIRIGNGEYARQNDSYGLTTLRNRHLDVKGSELRFHFKGKSGKVWRLNVRDRRIARVVRGIQELPGQHLFQYIDENGQTRAVSSGDVNEYLRAISGEDVSAKDFRTWAGTVLAVMALGAAGPFETKTQSKINVRRAIEAVAARLGNTAAVCRKCYVHPEIVACYLEGALPTVPAAVSARARRGLPPEEKAVLALLEQRLRPQRRKTRTKRPSTNDTALRKAA